MTCRFRPPLMTRHGLADVDQATNEVTIQFRILSENTPLDVTNLPADLLDGSGQALRYPSFLLAYDGRLSMSRLAQTVGTTRFRTRLSAKAGKARLKDTNP